MRLPEDITQEINRLLEYLNGVTEGQHDPQAIRELVAPALENIALLFEELNVAEEEIRQQNEQLVAMRSSLEEQRREYQNLFELAPVGYLITDRRGKIIDLNHAAEHLLNVNRQNFAHIHQDTGARLQQKVYISSYILIQQRKGFRKQLQLLSDSGRSSEWEQTVVPHNKAPFPALLRGVAQPAPADHPGRILWLIQDITARKEKEAKKQSALEFAENLFQSVREPLLVLRSDLRILLVNRAFYETFKTRPEETEGRHIYDLGDAQWNIPALRELLDKVISTRQSFEDYQVEHHFPYIGRKVMLLNARWIDHVDLGALILLAVEDVTQRVEAERRTQELMEQLQSSNENLEHFAYVASHDLQEPLRMVTSYVQLLAKRYSGKLDADADEFIGYAVDGTTRMKALIESLLQYSRVQQHGKEPERVDSGLVLQKVRKALDPLIQENQAAVTGDTLPVVMADPAQLFLVFQNLIENAIRYRAEEPPKIHMSARGELNEWVFSVADNGIGIEPRHQERIFRLFQRLHTRTEFPGTGLGLAISKRIIERHGGRIWVESAAGKGATFYFSLPRRGL